MFAPAEAALCAASLALLFLGGWAFVNARLYRQESEERDAVAQARRARRAPVRVLRA